MGAAPRPSARGGAVALRGALSLACLSGLSAVGCGGGVPLLYPARTLPPGAVRASGGTSGNFLVGSLAQPVSDAQSERSGPPPGGLPPGSQTDAARSALVLAAVGPGVAPYVSARVGLGSGFEAGATYTGRAAHLDVRRSFDWNDISLSIGLGVETPIYGDTYTSTLPGFDLHAVRGVGADVPVLVGWRSVASAYMVWGGARAGWDHTSVASALTESPTLDPDTNVSLSADRFYAGGVVGLAAGFRHVHVALEMDVAYQAIAGSYTATRNPTNVAVQGVSLAPAAAAWWRF